MVETRLGEMHRAKMSFGWFVGDARLPADRMLRLVYYARLAPSSHNTQPWKFVIGTDEIDVFADLNRWLGVADPDRRELHISIGCAIEAIRIAADYGKWGTAVDYFPVAHDDTLVARIRVAKKGPKRDMPAGALLEQVITRRTSHRRFAPDREISDADRAALYRGFQSGDVSLHYLQDKAARLGLAELERDADRRLFADSAYRDELAQWVGEGLLGTPWLISKLGQFAVSHLPVGEQVAGGDAARLASAPLVGLLTTRRDRPADAVQAGEAYMRIALMAERKGIRVQPVSQVLELPDTRSEVAKVFGLGDREAQHLFRLGYAEPETGPQRRRPLAEMVLQAEAAGAR